MRTFILLTFGFLAFAFYEMSGGADFEPASARITTAAPDVASTQQVADVAQPVAPASLVNTTSITKIDTSSSVTRVSVDLTNVASPAADATQQPEPRSTARIIDSTETPQIILPSLIAPAVSNAGNPVTGDTSQNDIRFVSGNRVNVRGGPSTNYGIISKLGRGDEVRILEDNGDGWVRMQPVDGGEAGWMADFLLTSG